MNNSHRRDLRRVISTYIRSMSSRAMEARKQTASSSKKDATKKQRVRPTNKSLESQRFSTVRMPAKSEVANHAASIHSVDKPTAETGTSMAFDPIPQDGMFLVVEQSSYWPPPPLESFLGSSAAGGGGEGAALLSVDGMDMYDRRADDAVAKQEKMKIAKQIKKAGELSHPRGKATGNAKVHFDDSD